MKNLKLNKKRLASLQEDQLASIVGGNTDPEIVNSCRKKTCNGPTVDNPAPTEDEIDA